MTAPLIKQPSAWVPMVMSGVALTLVLGYLAIFGITEPQAAQDEGTAAHLFQLLLAGQLPIIAFFAIKYLPRDFMGALLVLVLQALAGLIPLATIFLLEL
ncbi:MAG: hypothetical protein AAB367_04630 [Patescibacteria group bacterium]